MKKVFIMAKILMSAGLILCVCYVNTVFSRGVISGYGSGNTSLSQEVEKADKRREARRKARAEELKAWLKDMLDYERILSAADVENKALQITSGDRLEASHIRFGTIEAIAASHNRRVRRLQRQRSLQK